MEIRIDDLSGPEIADFLDQHIQEMRSVSPPESTHTLDLDGLKTPDVTFWSVWDGERLIACGALKKLDLGLAELKSMRTSPECRGNGVASDLLRHILSYAKTEGHSQLFLETGSMDSSGRPGGSMRNSASDTVLRSAPTGKIPAACSCRLTLPMHPMSWCSSRRCAPPPTGKR